MAHATLVRWTERPPGRRGERPEGPRFERQFGGPPEGPEGSGRGGPPPGFFLGRGGGERFAAEHGIPYLGGIPLDVTVRQGGDVGVPAVAQREPGPAARALTAIAGAVAAHVSVRAAAAEGTQPALSIS
jgi:hypothetical protein